MLRKKIKLLCYRKAFLKDTSCLILPCFLYKAFYLYNGRKYDRLFVSSMLFSFLRFSEFVFSTKFGPIHIVSKKKSKLKKKK